MVASNTSPSLYTSESKQLPLANESGMPCTSSSSSCLAGSGLSASSGLSGRFSETDLFSRFVPSSAYSFSKLSLTAASALTATSGGSVVSEGVKSGVLRGRGRSVFSRLIVRGRSVSQRGGVATANPLSHRILSREDLGG
jgi:hypothetical protein